MHIGKSGFLGAFMSDRHVAALQPSSSFVVRRLLAKIDPTRIRSVVEYGPGNGVVTFELLKALPATARYVAIERNPALAASLQKRDERLEAIEGDVREAPEMLTKRGLTSVDLIIASIPFTYFKASEREAIIASARRMLAPGGTLIVFHQYSMLMRPYLRRHFASVRTELEWRNLPPCFLFVCS
jgi:phospholipid N-methyltransferase